MTKKIPMRKCLATRQSFPKKDLIRLVRVDDDQVVIDLTGKRNGRGAYVSRSLEAIEALKVNHALEKAFKMKIDKELYEDLVKLILE